MADSIACAVCGIPFIRHNRYGPIPMYCGTVCKAHAGYRQRSAEVQERIAKNRRVRRGGLTEIPRACLWCGTSINQSWNNRRKYCSTRCTNRATSARRTSEQRSQLNKSRRKILKRPTRCGWCNKPLQCIPRGPVRRWCSEVCGGRARRSKVDPAELRRRRHEAFQRERAAGQSAAWTAKRRTDVLGRPSDSVTALALCIEQKYKCALCGKRINPKLRDRNPMMMSIDHVLPVSKGGDGLRANLRAVHLTCNLIKNNRVWGDGEQLSLC